MGFINDVKKIVKVLPKRRQTLFFSATMPMAVESLASNLLNKPEQISIKPSSTPVEKISQLVCFVRAEDKRKYLQNLLQEINFYSVIIFTRTKHGANRLAAEIKSKTIISDALHGNKSQAARQRTLKDFKSGKVNVLVATDIAARGLDIPLLPNVVNFELPNVPQDYIHRIGRTGRAGANGVAISLVCAEETSYLLSIEQLINKKFEKEIINGFEPDLNASTEPPKIGGNRQNRRFRSKNNKGHSKKKSGKPFKKKFRF